MVSAIRVLRHIIRNDLPWPVDLVGSIVVDKQHCHTAFCAIDIYIAAEGLALLDRGVVALVALTSVTLSTP